MKNRLPLYLLLALFAFGACKKPIMEVAHQSIPPLELTASIQDSLPATAVSVLKLNGLTGLKVKYHTGLYTSYFEYHADKNLLLKTLSELPFSLNAAMADTRCGSVSFHEMEMYYKSIPTYETEYSFWKIDRHNVEVYECIKPPFRHLVQITNSNQVFHRIEFLGNS
jgi:hypothetical protein